MDLESLGFVVVAQNRKWVKQVGKERVLFTRLEWFDQIAFEKLQDYQKSVWGFRDIDVVPSNLLTIIPDSGQDVLLAEDESGQWAGFLFGILGMETSGVPKLLSHMLGVRKDLRGNRGIGWNLKLLQAALALQRGITTIEWTADPLRGINAYLNLNKLASVADRYYVDKYGRLNTALYGSIPSDRFRFRWDLISPAVHERIIAIEAGKYDARRQDALASNVPELVVDNDSLWLVAQGGKRRPLIEAEIQGLEQCLVSIPYNVDTLSEMDKANERHRLRKACSLLMTCVKEIDGKEAVSTGLFAVTHLLRPAKASGATPRSFYVFKNKQLLAI